VHQHPVQEVNTSREKHTVGDTSFLESASPALRLGLGGLLNVSGCITMGNVIYWWVFEPSGAGGTGMGGHKAKDVVHHHITPTAHDSWLSYRGLVAHTSSCLFGTLLLRLLFP
jgi:hypothetical protein